jgi:hypothetical protein
MTWRVKIVDANLLIRSLKEPDLAESAFRQNPACDSRTSRKGAAIIWPSEKPDYTNLYVENPNDPVVTQEVMDGRAVVGDAVSTKPLGSFTKAPFVFGFDRCRLPTC